MRIGMILDANFPPDPRVENEAVSLVAAGHEVYLFCLTYTNENKNELIKGIHVVRYDSTKLEYKLSALAYTIPLYSFLMKKKIKNFIEKHQIDALHIHDIRVAEAVFWANKNYKKPVILDLHDNMPEVMKLYPHLQKFPGKYIISPKKWKKKETEFIKKASKVICVSPEFSEMLQQRFPQIKNKFVLVPNTIRASFYKDFLIDSKIINRYKEHFVALYLGDTHVRRGLLTAIESTAQIIKIIPNFKLVIVGKNTTDYLLKNKVEALNLNDYVDFEGWQDVSLFQSYIQASHVCISPLHRNLQHDVAYANKIFQYMSFGKPLLVSDAIAQKRLVEKITAGLVHQDRNSDDFTQKIITLYNNPSLCEQLGENGKKFVQEEFTWAKTAKNLIDLYNTISN